MSPSYDPSPPYPPRRPHDPSPPYPYGRQEPPPSPSFGRQDTSPAYPTYPTYPWQPPAPPQPPAPTPPQRRMPDRPPLGHHSDLRVLRGAYRWQRRVATLTALGYFTLFLILSAFAPGLMTSTVADGLPTGLLLALVQLPVAWLAIGLYERTARRRLDPIADRIRKQSEVDAKREAAGR